MSDSWTRWGIDASAASDAGSADSRCFSLHRRGALSTRGKVNVRTRISRLGAPRAIPRHCPPIRISHPGTAAPGFVCRQVKKLFPKVSCESNRCPHTSPLARVSDLALDQHRLRYCWLRILSHPRSRRRPANALRRKILRFQASEPGDGDLRPAAVVQSR